MNTKTLRWKDKVSTEKKLYHFLDSEWHLPFCAYYYEEIETIIKAEPRKDLKVALRARGAAGHWWIRKDSNCTIASIMEKYIEKHIVD